MRQYERSEKRCIDLSHSDLRGADFYRCYFDGAKFDGADLRSVRFQEAQLVQASFLRANLVDATFDSAKLMCYAISGANLTNAHFMNANLSIAVFSGSQLRGVCFLEAVLTDALFWSEKETSLAEVDFAKSHLEGVSLESAKDLTFTQIENSFGDERTISPIGLRRPDHWPPLKNLRREVND